MGVSQQCLLPSPPFSRKMMVVVVEVVVRTASLLLPHQHIHSTPRSTPKNAIKRRSNLSKRGPTHNTPPPPPLLPRPMHITCCCPQRTAPWLSFASSLPKSSPIHSYPGSPFHKAFKVRHWCSCWERVLPPPPPATPWRKKQTTTIHPLPRHRDCNWGW